MKTTIGTLFYLTLLFAPLVSTAEDDQKWSEIILVEGTDPEYDEEFRQTTQNSKSYREQLKADKKVVRDEAKAMKKDGFIIASERMVSRNIELASLSMQPLQDIEGLLGFQPTALDLDLEVLGVIHDGESSDGRIHFLITSLHHPLLGDVFVEETSISTIPKGRMSKRMFGPKFDYDVDGNPALLRIYVTEDGMNGRTALNILTPTKLTVVGVNLPILENDPLFDALIKLGVLAL